MSDFQRATLNKAYITYIIRVAVFTLFSLVSLSSLGQKLNSSVPIQGLVAYFSLSPTDQLGDVSGHGNHGNGYGDHINRTIPFRLVPGADRFGDSLAMALGSSDSYWFTVTPRENAKFAAAFSVGCWYRTTIDNTLPQAVFSKDLGNRSVIDLVVDGRVKDFKLYAHTEATEIAKSPEDLLSENRWRHLVATFDGQTCRLYVDSELMSELTFTPSELIRFKDNLANSGPFRIGRSQNKDVGYEASGSVDEVFIYDRPLNSQEIRQIFLAGGSIVAQKDIDLKFDPLSLNPQGQYPIVSSATKSKAAEAINKALQMNDFGKIRTSKKPDAFVNQPPEIGWGYDVKWPTDRLLVVHTIKTVYDLNSRGGGGEEFTYQYFFNSVTGDIVDFRSLFTTEGYSALTSAVKAKGVDLTHVLVDINPFNHNLTFWVAGDNYPQKYASVSSRQVEPFLSPTGRYYLSGGPVPLDHSVDHIWTGILGEKIHVTLLLHTEPNGTIAGKEIYDSFGETIPLSGKFVNTTLLLSELDPKGNAVATYEAKLEGRTLQGKWTKADGSKSFPLRATIAAE